MIILVSKDISVSIDPKYHGQNDLTSSLPRDFSTISPAVGSWDDRWLTQDLETQTHSSHLNTHSLLNITHALWESCLRWSNQWHRYDVKWWMAKRVI